MVGEVSGGAAGYGRVLWGWWWRLWGGLGSFEGGGSVEVTLLGWTVVMSYLNELPLKRLHLLFFGDISLSILLVKCGEILLAEILTLAEGTLYKVFSYKLNHLLLSAARVAERGAAGGEDAFTAVDLGILKG